MKYALVEPSEAWVAPLQDVISLSLEDESSMSAVTEQISSPLILMSKLANSPPYVRMYAEK